LLNVPIVIDDFEQFYSVRNYLQKGTDWQITWSDTDAIPPTAEIILINATKFSELCLRERLNSQNLPYNVKLIVYGNACHLATSFLLGCHEYIKFPWLPEEAYYHIAKFDIPSVPAHFFIDGVKIRVEDNAIVCGSTPISITITESSILRTLIRYKNQVTSLQLLHNAVRKNMRYLSINSIRVCICAIRRKLALIPSLSAMARNSIVTIPEQGYLLRSS